MAMFFAVFRGGVGKFDAYPFSGGHVLMSAQFKMTGVRLSYLAATGVFLVLIAVLIVFLQPFNEATRQISQANYLLTEVGAKLDAVVVTAIGRTCAGRGMPQPT